MRLPADNIPVTTVTENRYEIHQPDAATAVRPVAPHAAATQVYFPKRKPREKGQSGQSAREQAEEKRAGEDRRQTGRRADAETIILDTRTGLDRRTKLRRAGDVSDTGNQIDEFV